MTRTVPRVLSMLLFVCGIATVLAARQAPSTPPVQPASPGVPAAPTPDQEIEAIDTGEADVDEALQQLIAQAEALAGPGSPATVEAIALIKEELEALKAGLALKVSLLDEGRATTEADLEIASRREGLQAAIDAATEPDLSLDPAEPVGVEKEGERRGSMLAQIDSYVGEALSLIGKIQELLQIHRDEEAGTGTSDPDGVVAEEALEDVTGVVTESGEPLEGVAVTDPETGASAVTDSDGQYTLQGLVAGRPARLVLSKSGKQVGEGQLDPTPGHGAVGDFDLTASAGGSRPALRVLPYTVVVRGARAGKGSTGVLRGTLRDADGRPVPRALVSLGRVARARTSSDGRYAFLNVPVGAYELKVVTPGFPARTERVRVTAARVEASISLPARVRAPIPPAKPLIRAGSGVQLRGSITIAGGPPIRAARVTLIQSGKAVSVRSGSRGDFLFRDLEAGRYRVLVSKAGYRSVAEAVSLEPGASLARSYVLTRVAHRASAPARVVTPAVRTSVSASGQVVGRVLDAATKAPVAGAVVTLQGHEPVRTNTAGSYRILQVPPARHRVVVKTAGFATATRDIQVAGGRVARLDFALTTDRKRVEAPPAPARRSPAASLAGKVIDARTRRAIAGAVVAVGGVRVATDAAGTFRVPGLRAGAHRIAITADGYQDASEMVTLGPGDRPTPTFALIRAAAPARR